jgi:hypothetical protein
VLPQVAGRLQLVLGDHEAELPAVVGAQGDRLGVSDVPGDDLGDHPAGALLPAAADQDVARQEDEDEAGDDRPEGDQADGGQLPAGRFHPWGVHP